MVMCNILVERDYKKIKNLTVGTKLGNKGDLMGTAYCVQLFNLLVFKNLMSSLIL
jgi:hypothetical protein